MNELIALMNQIKPGIDYENEENLLESGIYDSLSIVRLVALIGDEFDVEITPLDLVPENFKSAKAIYELIKRLED